MLKFKIEHCATFPGRRLVVAQIKGLTVGYLAANLERAKQWAKEQAEALDEEYSIEVEPMQ